MCNSRKSMEEYYTIIYKKQYSLFWATVNMACMLLTPYIMSVTRLGSHYISIAICFFFLINIIYHVCVIFHYRKKPWGLYFNTSTENKENNIGSRKRKWSWVNIVDRSKLKEQEVKISTPENTFETSLSTFGGEAKQKSPWVNIVDRSKLKEQEVRFSTPNTPEKFFDSTFSTIGGSDSIYHSFEEPQDPMSTSYKYEVGVLVTSSRLFIKPCGCQVLDWKCRLCPFRVYPIEYFKSWFWYPVQYAPKECMECGESCLATEAEFRKFDAMSFPLHLCDCKCRYCVYADKYPLKPRTNLLPDDCHCLCICSKCRVIEELIQGLEPHEKLETPDEDLETSAWCDLSEEEKYFQVWSPPQTCNKKSSAAILKNLVHQFCPPGDNSYSRNRDSRILQTNNELWKSFGVNPLNLVKWTSNLRKWISTTILNRIVEEMNRIDDDLIAQGLTLVSIGNVGYETIKATAFSELIRKNVPSLLLLLPYLEITSNQQYIMQRIRELAEGSTMRDFDGQSGGKFNDIPWDAHLPSDAELIMHLMVTYFDAKLPPLISEPLKRPFSTQYFVESPKKPTQTELAIYQQGSRPPYYQLIVNGEIHQLPLGSNNVLYALLLFIHCIKTKHDGMLGRINLGPAGLNMLWIVEDTTRI